MSDLDEYIRQIRVGEWHRIRDMLDELEAYKPDPSYEPGWGQPMKTHEWGEWLNRRDVEKMIDGLIEHGVEE